MTFLPTKTSRWTRTLGRLSGKKNDSRPPSDRMLTATSDQQSRLRDLLSSGGGVDDEEVSTTPAESTPTVQTAPVSIPDRDDVEDEVPPAARIVADMEPHSIPGIRKNTGARAEMASSTLRKQTEKTSDSQAQPSHASMPSRDPIAAGPEAPERSTNRAQNSILSGRDFKMSVMNFWLTGRTRDASRAARSSTNRDTSQSDRVAPRGRGSSCSSCGP